MEDNPRSAGTVHLLQALTTHSVRASISHSGPIPHPDILQNYDEETRRAIVRMAERGQESRNGFIHKKLDYDYSINLTGRVIAGLLVLCAVIAGALLVYLGHDKAGGWIASIALGGGIVTAFVHSSKKEILSSSKATQQKTEEPEEDRPEEKS